MKSAKASSRRNLGERVVQQVSLVELAHEPEDVEEAALLDLPDEVVLELLLLDVLLFGELRPLVEVLVVLYQPFNYFRALHARLLHLHDLLVVQHLRVLRLLDVCVRLRRVELGLPVQVSQLIFQHVFGHLHQTLPVVESVVGRQVFFFDVWDRQREVLLPSHLLVLLQVQRHLAAAPVAHQNPAHRY